MFTQMKAIFMQYDTEIAVVVILIFTLTFTIKNWQRGTANPAYPSILITLGIGFTFLGIAMGLTDFQIDNPTESLPILIGGIKTAFWGSLTGVVCSLLLRLVSSLLIRNDKTDQIEEFYQNQKQITQDLKKIQIEQVKIAQSTNALNILVSQNDSLIKTLQNIHTDQKAQHEKLINTIDNLGAHLGNTSKQNMTEFFTKISNDLNELKEEFSQFAEKQRQSMIEIFMQSLTESIEKFNQQLTQSLGDNFKELNQAMLRLNEWQQAYKEQVEHQTQAYSVSRDQMISVQQHFTEFLQQTQDEFPKILTDIEQLMITLDQRNIEYNQKILQFYSDLGRKMIEFDQLHASFTHILEQINAIAKHTESTLQAGQSWQESLDKSIQSWQMALDNNIRDIQGRLNDGLAIIRDNLQSTHNQSLEDLARQLGSLSQKFANDYTPITRNLESILKALDTRQIQNQNYQSSQNNHF